MKVFFTSMFLLFASNLVVGQKKHILNFVLGGGPSYFFNDKTVNRRLNHSALIGANYTISNKHQNFIFCPGLSVQFNQFGTRTSEVQIVRLTQHAVSLSLDMLLRLTKKCFLRGGLFFNTVYYSEVYISNSSYSGSGYYGYANDQFYKGYSPANFQAGYTVGLSFPFKPVRRVHKFNIKFVHNVSSSVNSDYTLPEALVGKNVRFLSPKSKPTLLILGFDFSLERFEKKRKSEDEEE